MTALMMNETLAAGPVVAQRSVPVGARESIACLRVVRVRTDDGLDHLDVAGSFGGEPLL
ncbi:hypothetical protein [Kineosporia sp. NBRC 101731]|uniref:hypothetical protein n=1 Tax=Kineosporia sp. NBRC 101731 TaxID=3032199 RepID=UPI002553C673|nr:hypothetical protein [Kineosporia sp. NBRC 101731]